MGLNEAVDWQKGTLFDTLELGISAAAQGHGVSIGDLALVRAELQRGTLALPFDAAVRTGDSYYLVWPSHGTEHSVLGRMRDYLLANLPGLQAGVRLLD